MLNIVAHHQLKDGLADKYIQLMKAVMENSRKEDGCVSYKFYRHKRDENAFVMLEQWADKQALGAHGTSEFFLEKMKEVELLLAKPGELGIYSEIEV